MSRTKIVVESFCSEEAISELTIRLAELHDRLLSNWCWGKERNIVKDEIIEIETAIRELKKHKQHE